jgi:hypothetical protein
MRGFGWCAVVAVLTLALLAGAAEARERINTTVTIAAGEDATGQQYLGGKVKSPKAKCRRNRNVVLFFDQPMLPGGFTPVAQDRSNRRGVWRINAPKTEIPPGDYYARVRPVERRGDRCMGARSRTITVAAP